MACKEAIDNYVELLNDIAETKKCGVSLLMIAKARAVQYGHNNNIYTLGTRSIYRCFVCFHSLNRCRHSRYR